MGHSPRSLRVLVLHNTDYRTSDAEAHDFASRADVENAACSIAAALEARDHRALLRGIDRGDVLSAIAELATNPPDLVFNLCESLDGDARHELVIPALLDLAGIPYTGSGPVSLGIALRKDRAKDLLRAHGVPTPAALTLTHRDVSTARLPPFPLIVKPTREDASVGIHSGSVVRDRQALAVAVARVIDELHQPALIEQFVDGRELYVSLLGNDPPRALPFHEIDFAELPEGLPRIVSYSAKWDVGSPEFAGTRPIRCELDDATRIAVEEAARAAFHALELTDYGRIDVRLDASGTPWVIDVNPNCDLSAGAGFSRAAEFAGLDHPALIDAVCWASVERHARARAHLPRRLTAEPARHLTAADGVIAAAARPERSSTTPLAGRAPRAARGTESARAERRRVR